MENILYTALNKRKSFHSFNENRALKLEEITQIENYFKSIKTLCNNKIAFRLVKKETTSCPRGEYCILIYADKSDKNYLLNVGYCGEQLDLFLTSIGVGVCWYGFGRTKEKEFENLEFVIMLNIQKVEDDEFRADYIATNRVELSEFWSGDLINGVSDRVRFSPSACNSQPWLVVHKDGEITVSMTLSHKSIIPEKLKYFFHEIDMGIFLLFIELTLEKEGVDYTRSIINENNLIATYKLKGPKIN